MNEIPKFGDTVANGEKPPKRKYTRRAAVQIDKPKKKRKYTRKTKASVREWSCFLGEDNAIQLCPLNGEGESIDLTAADALAIADFVNRHRKALEV